MSFLYPAFLIGGLAIAVPIVLHLLRRDVAPELPFSAVHLLHKTPIERSKRRRLRDVLLLAARVVALLLLAAAFARPYRDGAAPPARIAVVAVDRSFSLSVPGSFDRARQLARAAVDEAGSARVAVIAFDERAEVVAPPGSAAEARAAIDRLTVGFGATRYGPAIARAAELAAGDAGRVTVITDLQRAGWEGEERPPLASNLELIVRDVGAPSGNVALTLVRSQPASVIATVRNEAPTPYRGTVRLALDGRGVASGAVTLAPGATSDVVIPYQAPAAGTLVAAIDDPSGMAADNERTVLLGAASRTRVVVVTSGTADAGAGPAGSAGLYVERALEAASSEEPVLETVFVDGARLSRERAALLGGAAAVMLLSTRQIDRDTRDALPGFVRRGGGLIVTAGPDVDATALAGIVGRESTRAADPDRGAAAHPGCHRLAAPDFPPVRIAHREPRPGGIHAGVAAARGGLGCRGVVHRRLSGARGAARRRRAGPLFHLGPRPAVERFPAPPGVRAIRGRVGSLRGPGHGGGSRANNR